MNIIILYYRIFIIIVCIDKHKENYDIIAANNASALTLSAQSGCFCLNGESREEQLST